MPCFFNADEIQGLLSNYRLTNIQEAENSNLFLEGTTVNLYRPENNYICQALKLLLQDGLAFDNLIEKIYDKIRLIFELNSLLINVVDPLLHKCCNSIHGFIPGMGCVAKYWDKRIRDCFINWSKTLERTRRQPNN